MSEIGACFSEPPLRLEGSVHGQSEAPREDGVGAYATLCLPLGPIGRTTNLAGKGRRLWRRRLRGSM